MVGSKGVSFLHRVSDAYRRGFFRDRKMQHTARGLLAYEHFSDPFLEGSDPSHPAVNIQTGFAGCCHRLNRPRARKVALLGTPARNPLSASNRWSFIALGRTSLSRTTTRTRTISMVASSAFRSSNRREHISGCAV